MLFSYESDRKWPQCLFTRYTRTNWFMKAPHDETYTGHNHRLGPGDIDQVRGLLDVFGKAFEDVSTYTAAQPDRHYLDKLLGSETVVVLVALQGAEVIGGLVAYELGKLEQRRSEIYIYDLAVAEQHRRRGVATDLIAQVRIIASQCGAHVVYVQADLEDEPAIQLYTKLGTREDVLHFDLRDDAFKALE